MSWLLEVPIEITALLLRVGVLVVLYAFLAAILRSIWQDLRREARSTFLERRPHLIVERSAQDSRRVGEAHALLAVTSIGRLPSCTLVLDDPHVSSRHAEIQRQDDAWVLRDLDSTNGTRVNGILVEQPVRLRDGDQLEIGALALRFQER